MPYRAPGYQATSGFTSDSTLRDGDTSTGYERSQAGNGQIEITAKLDLGASPAAVTYLKAFVKWNQALTAIWQYSDDDVTYTTPPYSSPTLPLRSCTYGGAEYTWTLTAPVSARYWRLSVRNIAGQGTVPGCANIQIGVMELWPETAGSVEIPETGGGSTVALSGSGTITITGTGALTIDGMALAGSGVVTITGAGDMTLPIIGLAGSGVVTITGAGRLIWSIPLSGSGVVTITGTGEMTGGSTPFAGSGVVFISGTAEMTAVVPLSGSGEAETKGRGVSNGGIVVAQSLFDFVSWYPGIGDVWGHTDGKGYDPGKYGRYLELRAAKILRGASWGLVADGEGEPEAQAIVKVTQSDDDSERGQAETDAWGYYVTGLPFGRSTRQHDTTAEVDDPFPVITRLFYARKRHRAAFRGDRTDETGGWISYDVAPSMVHARAFTRDGTIWIGIGSFAGLEWSDVDTGIAESRPAIRFDRARAALRLWLVSDDGSNVRRRYSLDEGATWMATTVIGAGKYGALCLARHGLQYLYWRSSSGAIKGVIYDNAGAQVQSEFTAIESGVAEDAISCWEYVTQGGEWRIKLLYRTGDNIVTSDSSDGMTFS